MKTRTRRPGEHRTVSGAATPARRPRLLFLCQTLPFPPDGGVHIRSYNVLRLLSRAFDVTALCFYRKVTRPTAAHVEAALDGLRPLAAVEAFPIPQEHSSTRLLWDHLRSVVSRRVYTHYAHESARFAERCRRLLADPGFDLVHLDSLDLSACLPLLEGLPVMCTHHNVESALLRRRARTERSPVLRRYLELQASLARKEEQRWCSRVALNVVVSASDRASLERLVPDARLAIVPNGVDTAAFRPGRSPQNGVVFVGGYSWFPNRDAMEYFCAEILPRVRAGGHDAGVTWVGRAPQPVRHHYASRFGIRLTGYVDDIRPYVHEAACYAVPLRAGGGTRLKILDAWAMGKAVVSTSIGCEGLDARDGDNILVRDHPHEFAAAVRRVLDDPQLRERLGANARATAEQTYDWDVIGESMLRAYLELAGRPPLDAV